MMPHPGYNPHIHPAFQQPSPSPSATSVPSSSAQDHLGTEPMPNDLATSRVSDSTFSCVEDYSVCLSQGLAKAFGVSPAIVGDLKLAPTAIDTEDLAVGFTGLSSRRDYDRGEPSIPRDSSKWISVAIHDSPLASPTQPNAPLESKPLLVWLPKDRKMVQQILDAYFTRLNIHRPVFTRGSFEQGLEALYRGAASDDPGFLCSVYLIFALGTLSELNRRANGLPQDVASGTSATQKVMPSDWPTHEEFFNRALIVKPDLRVTLSSLQALILLHWYLYTEVSSNLYAAYFG
jgi:hypothetical protein